MLPRALCKGCPVGPACRSAVFFDARRAKDEAGWMPSNGRTLAAKEAILVDAEAILLVKRHRACQGSAMSHLKSLGEAA